MNYIEKTMCENIIFLKERKGLSVEKMSKIIGLSADVLNDLLKGKVSWDIPISVLFNIHRNFEVPPDALLGDDTKIIEKYCEIFEKKGAWSL